MRVERVPAPRHAEAGHIAGGGDRNFGQRGDPPRDEVRFPWLARGQRAVDAFTHEVDEAVGLAEVELEVRIIGEEAGKSWHNEAPRLRAVDIDAQETTGSGAAEGTLGLFNVVENREAAPVIGLAIALVTGASRTLGRNMAIALARSGVNVIGTYHSNKAEADATVAAITALGREGVMFRLDTGNITTFAAFAVDLKQALAANWSRPSFDFLVNNAGIGIHASFAETTEADFDRLLAINLKGVFFLTQTLLPLIADGGRIVNLSSGLARFSPLGYAAYAAMKGGVEVLTRYLAKELGPRGIAVNTIALGAIETDFAGGSVRDNKHVNDFIASVTALGRPGLPDDIRPALASLLSEDNRWINAQCLEVSGGMFV